MSERTIVLAVMCLLVGLVFGYHGFVGIRRGHTTSRGVPVQGKANTLISVLRMAAGFGCAVAGIWFGVEAFR